MEERSENTPKKQPKIEIITGDTTDLNISNVRDNLTFEVNKEKPNKDEIVIPKTITNQNKDSE